MVSKGIVAAVALVFLVSVLGAFLLSFPYARTMMQADTPAIIVYPQNGTAELGENITIEVNFENFSTSLNAVAFQFNLTWDPSILQNVSKTMEEVLFHNITPPLSWYNIGEYMNTVNNNSALYGVTWHDEQKAVSEGYSPVNVSSGTLARITLKCIGKGQTNLSLDTSGTLAR